MSRLTELIAQVATTDPALADDLRREVGVLSSRRPFGLNFERHVPESVQLPSRKIRRGDKVVFRNPSGSDQQTWVVVGFEGTGSSRNARLVLRAPADEPETTTAPLNDLVVIAEFRDAIYPGLRSTGVVGRGGDKPFHAVVNGENYHVLQALSFACRGRVDCIYIDPPYNTRDKDWKYNNDYVDSDDGYRHSKWLAMMERRLRLASELLNPDRSVLIVTIDEKEYLRLGLLLEQMFSNCTIQMISSVIKPGGTSRTKEFSRVEEYIYFVFFGAAEVIRSGDNMLSDERGRNGSRKLSDSDFWEGMVRRGIGVVRSQRPKQFYPIYIDPKEGRIVESGESLSPNADRHAVPMRDGLVAVWPIKDDLSEGFWQLSPKGLAQARKRGTVRVGGFNEKTGQWRIQYMKARKAKFIEDGVVKTKGKDENGAVILDLDTELSAESTPRTVWNRASHDASVGGAGMLNKLLPGRKFPFPKSLYAVEDVLRFVVGDKSDALILDFFAGSGTTAHAVMRLNRQDEGRRRSIVVTNNEVSPEEAAALRAAGYRPGDAPWEALGICEHITKLRIAAAVTGETPEGEPISGDYRFVDVFPIHEGFAENVEFFDLTYEDPERVRHGLGFNAIAPLLWLRAGTEGSRINDSTDTFAIADRYAILFDLDAAAPFVAAVRAKPDVRLVYVVTDDETQFQVVAAQLPSTVESVRLYAAYLDDFRIQAGA
jgi:adenine-specific DNA-methyltransferase